MQQLEQGENNTYEPTQKQQVQSVGRGARRDLLSDPMLRKILLSCFLYGVTCQTCSNVCVYSSDGDCDDGGIGSEFSLCTCGQDCADCGPCISALGTAYPPPASLSSLANPSTPPPYPPQGPQPTPPPLPPSTPSSAPPPKSPGCTYDRWATVLSSDGETSEPVRCTEKCLTRDDVVCDDGGPGSQFADCQYGSDCTVRLLVSKPTALITCALVTRPSSCMPFLLHAFFTPRHHRIAGLLPTEPLPR